MVGKMVHSKLVRQVEYLKVENEILRKRIGKCIRPTAIEKRKLLKFGAPLGKDIRNIISIVTYETFLLWVRRYKRKKDSEKTKKRGRPRTPVEIRLLVVKMAKENTWGYVRILGELKKLNINRLSKSGVKNILKKDNLDPAPQRSKDTWDSFIKRHVQTLWACDFFTKQVLTMAGPRMLFVLFFINVRTRKVYVAGATRYPNQEWVNKHTQNILPLLGDNRSGKKLLIRDRDKKFSGEFDELFKSNGFTVQKTPFMSPNMNAYAESWIGTIKKECLNHFVVFGERHLRYLIGEYVAHYNTTRPHSSMGNRPLESRLNKDNGEIKCQSKLGGIIKNYYRG
ncbi:MAG: integrase core domain-containing protein [Gammaproteobacteria bacterium]|nr:integrase core domain-containing protein [Gammaproteobacteria bacterium]